MTQEMVPDPHARHRVRTAVTAANDNGIESDTPWQGLPDDLLPREHLYALFALAIEGFTPSAVADFRQRLQTSPPSDVDALEGLFYGSHLDAMNTYAQRHPRRMDVLQAAYEAVPRAPDPDQQTAQARLEAGLGTAATYMFATIRALPLSLVAGRTGAESEYPTDGTMRTLFGSGFRIVTAIAGSNLLHLNGEGEEIAVEFPPFGTMLAPGMLLANKRGVAEGTPALQRAVTSLTTDTPLEGYLPWMGCPILASDVALRGLYQSYHLATQQIRDRLPEFYFPRVLVPRPPNR
jgi:hypothetical protein